MNCRSTTELNKQTPKKTTMTLWCWQWCQGGSSEWQSRDCLNTNKLWQHFCYDPNLLMHFLTDNYIKRSIQPLYASRIHHPGNEKITIFHFNHICISLSDILQHNWGWNLASVRWTGSTYSSRGVYVLKTRKVSNSEYPAWLTGPKLSQANYNLLAALVDGASRWSILHLNSLKV